MTWGPGLARMAPYTHTKPARVAGGLVNWEVKGQGQTAIKCVLKFYFVAFQHVLRSRSKFEVKVKCSLVYLSLGHTHYILRLTDPIKGFQCFVGEKNE